MRDEDRIGKSWTIPVPEHVGHMVTVRGRDPIEKHGAFWLDCSCGDAYLVGELHIDNYIANEGDQYKDADRYHQPPRQSRRVRIVGIA